MYILPCSKARTTSSKFCSNIWSGCFVLVRSTQWTTRVQGIQARLFLHKSIYCTFKLKFNQNIVLCLLASLWLMILLWIKWTNSNLKLHKYMLGLIKLITAKFQIIWGGGPLILFGTLRWIVKLGVSLKMNKKYTWYPELIPASFMNLWNWFRRNVGKISAILLKSWVGFSVGHDTPILPSSPPSLKW